MYMLNGFLDSETWKRPANKKVTKYFKRLSFIEIIFSGLVSDLSNAETAFARNWKFPKIWEVISNWVKLQKIFTGRDIPLKPEEKENFFKIILITSFMIPF